jgi:hypothetical protein
MTTASTCMDGAGKNHKESSRGHEEKERAWFAGSVGRREDTKTIFFVGRTRREGEDARFPIHPRSGVWDPSRARSWGSHTDGGFTFGLLFCIYRLEILLIPFP